jgi:hypothetical protein
MRIGMRVFWSVQAMGELGGGCLVLGSGCTYEWSFAGG